MRAALYIRVSTDKQTEKFGISSQLHELRKRCKEKDWVPVFDMDNDNDAFIDDGFSGPISIGRLLSVCARRLGKGKWI